MEFLLPRYKINEKSVKGDTRVGETLERSFKKVLALTKNWKLNNPIKPDLVDKEIKARYGGAFKEFKECKLGQNYTYKITDLFSKKNISYIKHLTSLFELVYIYKPYASPCNSPEVYVVCINKNEKTSMFKGQYDELYAPEIQMAIKEIVTAQIKRIMYCLNCLKNKKKIDFVSKSEWSLMFG